jgi:hypothetical protein
LPVAGSALRLRWLPRSSHFGQRGLDMVSGGEFGARERGGDEGVMREEIDLECGSAG